MLPKKTAKKSPKYFCEFCDYKCSRAFLWKQHISTAKHIGNANRKNGNGVKTVSTSCSDEIHVCENCNKVYKQRSGLWRHKKRCLGKIEISDGNLENIEDSDSNEEDENDSLEREKSLLVKENNELKSLMKQMVLGLNQDVQMKNEMMGQIKEQNKLIQEMIPRMGNNNNNRFNINVFLNEQCRDAINMSEFLASLNIKVEDLKFTQNNGLIEGISSVLVNGLRELDTCKRPIHCTDEKRETLYVKENDEWNRDKGKSTLRDAIENVADKQRKAISDWEKNNPDWQNSSSGQQEYIQIVQSVMADVSGESNENKIIKTIAKETIIDK